MTPMTPEDRELISRTLIGSGHPAAPELVLTTAERLRAGGMIAETVPGGVRHELAAIIRRLLDAERDIEALRRVLAEVVAIADDNPDVGLTGAEVTHLATARGIDLRQDIEAAEVLREAEQLAGAR